MWKILESIVPNYNLTSHTLSHVSQRRGRLCNTNHVNQGLIGSISNSFSLLDTNLVDFSIVYLKISETSPHALLLLSRDHHRRSLGSKFEQLFG